VGPRACLEDVEKRRFLTLPGLELRTLGRPARSQSLYRLRYAGSQTHNIRFNKNSFISSCTFEECLRIRITFAREIFVSEMSRNQLHGLY
jgi:hypothetical protein